MGRPKITDDDIRELFNIRRDGTATDALIRHTCQVALGERVIGDPTHPAGARYPYADERQQALARCWEVIASAYAEDQTSEEAV